MRLRIRVRNSMWPYRDRYASYVVIPEFCEYEGTVVRKPSWLEDNQFMITTGDSQAPFRILCKDDIVCGWRLEDVGDVHVVPGRNGRQYMVTVSDDGDLNCNCVGFGYHNHCSHVGEVMARAH